MAVKQLHAEIATAIGTGALGFAGIVGASELGFGWSEQGPEPGYFTFYVGMILLGASLWNLVRAFVKSRGPADDEATGGNLGKPFLEREQLVRVGRFFGALVVFVVATAWLGIYVGSTGYIAWSAWRQGGYRLPVALSFGAGFAIALYILFEMVFRIPLLKGPIEPLLGIY